MIGTAKAQSLFFLSQALLIVGLLWLFFRRRTHSGESRFRLREADRARGRTRPASFQNEKLRKEGPPLLEGIQIDGPPHSILGVAHDASRDEIQKAYRERMKRYHPDRVGRPGSREWTDAQKIAEAINRAKDEMLRRTRL